MAEAPSVSFVMYGARAAIASGMLHINEQVKAIESAVAENPGLSFDLAKTLIESVCRTILVERTIPFDPGDDLPKLFKSTTTILPFLPPSASGEIEGRKSLAQTLNGLHTAILGVCELRNQYGFASHGTSGPKPAMESVQALLAAEAADAIVGFLFRIHQQDRLCDESQRITYDENIAFNEYVDDTHELIRIFDVEFKPSEVLYQMEPETYRVYLTEFEPGPDEEKDGTGESS